MLFKENYISEEMWASLESMLDIVNEENVDEDEILAAAESMILMVNGDENQIATESWYYKPWIDYRFVNNEDVDDIPQVKEKRLYIMVRNQKLDGVAGNPIPHWTSIKVYNSRSKSASIKDGAVEVSVEQEGNGPDRKFVGLGRGFNDLKHDERVLVENFVKDNFMYIVEYWMAEDYETMHIIAECMRQNVINKNYTEEGKNGKSKFKVNYDVCMGYWPVSKEPKKSKKSKR